MPHPNHRAIERRLFAPKRRKLSIATTIPPLFGPEFWLQFNSPSQCTTGHERLSTLVNYVSAHWCYFCTAGRSLPSLCMSRRSLIRPAWDLVRRTGLFGTNMRSVSIDRGPSSQHEISTLHFTIFGWMSERPDL